MTSLILKNISLLKNKEYILKDITFSVKKDDFLVLTGPNGGGKTSLCEIITGNIQQTHGFYKSLYKISYAKQKYHENITIPICVKDFLNLTKDPIDKDLSKSIGLEKIIDKPIVSLSGGQRQILNLCNAFRQNDNIIILDEPDQNLDFESRDSFYNFLDRIIGKRTIIIVSHDMHKILTLREKNNIICINKSLHCFGSPETVLH